MRKIWMFAALVAAALFGLSATTGITQAPGRILFVSNRDGNPEIYVMDGDGGRQTRLTANDAPDWQASWSPDGTRIAFTSFRDGNPEIYVMNADGSEQRRLTQNKERDDYPAWSPDGARLAFTSERDGKTDIHLMNADGTGLVRLTANGAVNINPFWSPDGARVYFFANYKMDIFGGKTGTYAISAGGGTPVKVAEGGRAAVSPDGSRIAYVDEVSGGGGSYSYPGPGGTLRTDTSAGKTKHRICVAAADGNGRRSLIATGDGNSFPCWSPDGATVAYAGGNAINLIRADGKGRATRLKVPFAAGELSWSPDGTRISCMGSEGAFKKMSIFVTAADGSGRKRLTDGTWDTNPVWSPR